jgi:hypothetical protein
MGTEGSRGLRGPLKGQKAVQGTEGHSGDRRPKR